MTFVCCQKFYCFSRFLFQRQHKIKEESGHGDAVTPLSLFIYVRICRQSGSKWDVLLIVFLLYMLLVFGEFALSDVCQAVMLVMLGEVETHLFALC